jgi:hypothetical protein
MVLYVNKINEMKAEDEEKQEERMKGKRIGRGNISQHTVPCASAPSVEPFLSRPQGIAA